jgi:hypothetical protein
VFVKSCHNGVLLAICQHDDGVFVRSLLVGEAGEGTLKTQDRSGNVISNSGDTRASLIPPSE